MTAQNLDRLLLGSVWPGFKISPSMVWSLWVFGNCLAFMAICSDPWSQKYVLWQFYWRPAFSKETMTLLNNCGDHSLWLSHLLNDRHKKGCEIRWIMSVSWLMTIMTVVSIKIISWRLPVEGVFHLMEALQKLSCFMKELGWVISFQVSSTACILLQLCTAWAHECIKMILLWL